MDWELVGLDLKVKMGWEFQTEHFNFILLFAINKLSRITINSLRY